MPAGGKPQVRILTVDEPALFARALFIEALRRNGVKANAAIARPGTIFPPDVHAYATMPKVATFTSPPFKDAIAVTLKVSHNLYASTMPCLVAVAKGSKTAEVGLREERRILKELGVDVNQVSFGGAVVRRRLRHRQGHGAIAPGHGQAAGMGRLQSGVAGAGSRWDAGGSRPAFQPGAGKVFAKTGTLVWFDASNDRLLLKSKALAGTMTTKSGTPLYLAFFVNNVPLPDGVVVSREGKVLGKLCEVLYESGS